MGIVTGRAPPPHAPIHITSFRAVPVGCGSDVSALGATVHSSSHRTDAVVCCLKPVQKRQWRGLRACRGRVIPTDPGPFPLTPEGRRLGGGGLVLVGARAASELRVYVDRLFALAFVILTFFSPPHAQWGWVARHGTTATRPGTSSRSHPQTTAPRCPRTDGWRTWPSTGTASIGRTSSRAARCLSKCMTRPFSGVPILITPPLRPPRPSLPSSPLPPCFALGVGHVDATAVWC